MNTQHKAIRALLTTMCPDRAVDYLSRFHLPAEEEQYVLEIDVRKKSYQQFIEEHGGSPEAIKRGRYRAYAKMADGIEYQKSKSQG